MTDKKEKITIAFFLPTLEAGGTERNVVNLVNNIDTERYDISLVLGAMQGDFINQVHRGIPITDLRASYSIGLFFALVRYFKVHEPNVFVSAFPRINIIAIAARIFSRTSTKVIVTEHSVFSALPVIAKTFWRRLFARFLMPSLGSLMYPYADAILCVSRGIADDIAKIVNNPDKIKVVYNPVIDESISKLAEESLDHPWFFDQKIPVIIAVGRLVACKDYPTLLRAFKLIIEKQPARLVILGSGPEKEMLVGLVDHMGLSGQVAFLGFQQNPFKYMARASVFVLSSLQEGFGNVIIEAMACRVPVVSTNCPVGPGEIIMDGKNGILVPVGNEKSMAEAIMEILDNPVLAEKFRIEGKKRSEFFSVRKSVDEYEKTFQALCSKILLG